MDKLNKFVKDNKKVIIIVVIIILVLLAVWYFYYKKVEHMDNLAQSKNANTLMNALVGKNVFISTKISGNKYYLSVSPLNDCANLVNSISECKFAVPVLLNKKNAFSNFEIGRHLADNLYTIRSLNQNINSPNLTQNLNFYGSSPVNKLCFDNDKSIDVIYFETDLIDAGVLIKFKKAGQYYWVGACSDSTCNQDIRLCLFTDPKMAIPFSFEMTTPVTGPIKKASPIETFSFDDGLSSYNSTYTMLGSLPGFNEATIYHDL
ncbi:MAG: hypothetical protein Barrevirus3_11 [Barrevirus sp.]|uniref:Uncharacterized protein n=1 Tax=Barrevirus sp. TaxID=2487763 RepID=A0A3G4ZSA5_9VIRU|nr:MAG: hypothetical protein Barrevirus3_11 [Barrevirus sp.]